MVLVCACVRAWGSVCVGYVCWQPVTMTACGQAYRWIADSRDEASKKRLEALDDSYKLYRCV